MRNCTGYIGLYLAAMTVLLTGCDIDSAENAARNPGINVEGFYVGQGDGPVVPTTSGAPVLNMNLTQNGDQLQVIENNGIIFRGSLGQVVDTRASFTLTGRATSGQEVTISGTFTVNGTTSSMQGSWIEPTLVSTVFGTATVAEAPTPPDNGPDNPDGGEPRVSVSPSTATLAIGENETFTASGGNGSFTWSQSSTRGTLTLSGSGNSTARFTATVQGSTTLTVRDTASDSTTVSITVEP